MFNISHALKLHYGNETDMQALLAIKEKVTQDPHGVIYGHLHQRVTKLHLTSLDLVGTLSPFIGNLTFLTSLKIELNNFHGKIPPQVGGLFRLQHLSLTNNSFPGDISINESRLQVHNNNLNGPILVTLGNLSTIKSLSLSVNNLEGTIPSSLSQLKTLNVLRLGINKLSGIVPAEIFNLSSLEIFTVCYNQLYGTLPSEFGLSLLKLKSLSNASNLVELDAYGSNFTSKVSIDFGGLSDLWWLILASNSIGTGVVDDLSFFNSLSRCRNLKVLDLSDSKFGGNQLFVCIHSGIGNLFNLTELQLQKNDFSGSIPEVVSNLRRLQLVDLSENKFSGSIPPSMSNMTQLYSLHLEKNELIGNIPLSFGDFWYLQDLNLSRNHLSGTIPDGFMSLSSLTNSLNLADNQLLDISNNMLYGKIPSSIGRCVDLESLVLAGNFFEGIIPSSISSLKGLVELDLSRNNLSGQISTSLQLISLKKSVFRNGTAISISGNRKLCGGIPELELPICPNADPGGNDKSRSIKLMIPLLSGLFALVFIMSLVIIIRLRKARGEPSLTSSPVTYETLYRATNGFSSANLIGNGSFSSVYKGVLDPGDCMVAVKVINIDQQGATSKSFMVECEALKNVRHQNLVKIYTTCSTSDFECNSFIALVYEYMPNGSLESWLHSIPRVYASTNEVRILGLVERLSISIDVSCALEYLHNHCHNPIVFCDLKPDNILLNNDMTAHVADFGLTMFFSETMSKYSSIGYAAPGNIYSIGGKASEFGDVYNYGILLLEMFTGKRRLTASLLNDIVDPILLPSNNRERQEAEEEGVLINQDYTSIKQVQECLVSIIQIGVACSVESLRERMDIEDVVKELQLIRDILLASHAIHSSTSGLRFEGSSSRSVTSNWQNFTSFRLP
ncbi:hypothetical protein R3W88_019268 [Solanum pinnatisectum]|uniref:Protein kinase domain-containing protein n=1 Tax=Solanum pinnatisectum TaxID=50273 RepID=A0AAV9KJG0_9SOLN|nr:hypothetical protein R3W88_019268 [Solanum pinnatisectum]